MDDNAGDNVDDNYIATPVALRELPNPPAGFAGRGTEVDALLATLAPQQPTQLCALCGPAGTGTTALLLAAAHEAMRRGWFHRVVYVDLGGSIEMDSARVLDALLRALDVPPAHIGSSLAERFGLYRTELGVAAELGQPVLVVADNVASSAQVRDLLPGPGGNRVLVASPTALRGLSATENVEHQELQPLSQDGSLAVLSAALRIAGTDDARIVAAPVATSALTRVCGGSPLAVRVTAAILALDSARNPAHLGDELAELATGAGEFPAHEVGIHACLSAALERLTAEQAELLDLIARAPGPCISTRASAAMAERSHEEVLPLLRELARLQLIAPQPAGWLTMHPRVRDFVRRREARMPERRWVQAEGHLLRHYTRAAREAGRGQYPDAAAWLDTERPNLVAAVSRARDTGHTEVALHLPRHLAGHLDTHRYTDDWLHVAGIASSSAVAAGDLRQVATALTHEAAALARAGRGQEAVTAYQRAGAVLGELGEVEREARCRSRLGAELIRLERLVDAAAAYERACVLFAELGLDRREAGTQDQLGYARARLGFYESAVTAHTRAQELYRELADAGAVAACSNRLGAALLKLGRFSEALAAHETATAHLGEDNQNSHRAVAIHGQGLARYGLGHVDEAISDITQALQRYSEVGNRSGAHRAEVTLQQLRWGTSGLDFQIP